MLPKHSVGAEIGVHKGDFSAVILATVAPDRLHLIDPWQLRDVGGIRGCVVRRPGEGWPGGDGCALRVGESNGSRPRSMPGPSSSIAATSVDVLSDLPDDYFDWVYIDGNHLVRVRAAGPRMVAAQDEGRRSTSPATTTAKAAGGRAASSGPWTNSSRPARPVSCTATTASSSSNGRQPARRPVSDQRIGSHRS